MRKNKPANRGTLKSFGERGLLNWILPRLQKRGSYLVPPGDDAAVLNSIGKPVLSIDGLAEGTHFKLSWKSRLPHFGLSLGRALGWKLLGSSLSDLASMGDVENCWAMIFVASPPSLESQFLKDFFHGLQEMAGRHHCLIVGGDTVRGKNLTLAAAVGGTLSSRPLMRSGARAGDVIGMVGSVGDAARGLEVLLGRLKIPQTKSRFFVRRFFDSAPMFNAGRLLSREQGVTSLMDLSDSLPESIDLLLASSKLGSNIDLDAIPRSPIFMKVFGQSPKFVSGGEDYALLFTVSPKAAIRLARRLPFNAIGLVSDRGRPRQYFSNGRPVSLQQTFEHFH